MASLSMVRPARRGQWAVRIDATGAIQPLDGHSSDYSFAAICGGSPALEAAVGAGIRAVAAGQADTFSLEFACRAADGGMRVRLRATPERRGAVKFVQVTHTDADAADAAEDTGPDNQAHKMEALGRLAGGVAHDFANLVTLVSGYSDMLLNRIGAQDPSRPELEEIRRAAAHGAALTARILDFIRKQVAAPTIVQLNSLVAEMMKLLRPIVGEHIGLAVTLDPNLGVVKAGFAEIDRVVMNLVLNARDAMPGGGEITIRTANLELAAGSWPALPPGRYVTLEVSDHGAGMPPETLRRIFQPFFTTKEGGGTGLGLHTVQRIVEQAGGGIRVRSQPGQGSTFTICLPRACGAGMETILLAEDEDSVRKLLKRLLDAGGYRVLEAADGRHALSLFEQHAGSIDLLLTDVIMPGMNGRELARQALASKPSLRVIYMSGYTEDVVLNAGAPRPGMSFLRKPLQLNMLSARIREVLDTPALQ